MLNWKGTMLINGEEVSTFSPDNYTGDICIQLKPSIKPNSVVVSGDNPVKPVMNKTVLQITVKAYMTRQATPEFDFMAKYNNNKPMPLRTMVGEILKETKGMYYMTLRGDTTGKPVTHCLKCGRIITNKVSQYFGMGPECGEHNYTNPFETQEELDNAVAIYRKEYLNKLTWEGWVIKSAIVEQQPV